MIRIPLSETRPGTLHSVITAPEILKWLRNGPIELQILASDELNREVHNYRLTLEKGTVHVDLLFQRVGAKLTAKLAKKNGRPALVLTLEQSPKVRFYAVLKLIAADGAEALSDPAITGTRHEPTINVPRIVAGNDSECLIYVTTTDVDGFEDIRYIKLFLGITGQLYEILFDIETHEISFPVDSGGTPHPVVLGHCDIEYFTNQVRVLVAIKTEYLNTLEPEIGIEVCDHFSGTVRKTAKILDIDKPPPVPRLASYFTETRATGTDWISALKAHRDAFPNSAVMVKRPSLPVVNPHWIGSEKVRAAFTRPDWIPQEDIDAHFEGETRNGPLVFKNFPVTHMMWSYSQRLDQQREYIENVNCAISMGSLSFHPGRDRGFNVNDIAALDFDLEPRVIPSWKVAFSHAREVLSPLRPVYWNLLRQRLTTFVKMGATSVQLDDYPNAGVCVTYGGDFCDESRAGFTQWLKDKTTPEQRRKAELPEDLDGFDYRDWLVREKGITDAAHYMRVFSQFPSTALFRGFQWQVALESWRKVREILDEISPDKHITLTSNGAPDWPAPEAYAYNSAIMDAMCAEIHIYPQRPKPDVAALNAYFMTDGLGTRLAAVPKGEENTLISAKHFNDKRLIHVAESYAMGHQLMVPWGNWRKDVKRLYDRWQDRFGITFPYDRDESFACEPGERIGDIFQFVLDKAYLLDGFQRYANVALVLRYKTLTIKMRYLARQLLARHVQFTYIFADETLHPRPMTSAIAQSFDHILLADAQAAYGAESGVKGEDAVYGARMAKQAIPRPVWCSNSEVYVTIMQKGSGSAREVVVHVLNRQYDPSGEGAVVPVENLNIRLKKSVVGTKAPVIHDFRGNAELEVNETDTEFKLRINKLNYWSLLHFAQSTEQIL